MNNGSWGPIPTALQQTPPGGTLCGTIVSNPDASFALPPSTVILSTLWGQQIFDFYNPLVTTAGCTLAPMSTTAAGGSTVSSTSYSCTSPKGGGTITADGTTDSLTLTYAASGG